METVQAFLKVSKLANKGQFLNYPQIPLGLIVHGLCFLGVSVCAIECINSFGKTRQDTLFHVVNMLSHTASLQIFHGPARGKKMILK